MSWQKGRRKSKYPKNLVKARSPLVIKFSIDTAQLQGLIRGIRSAFDSPSLRSSLGAIFNDTACAANRFAIALSEIGFPVIHNGSIGDTSCMFNARSPELRCAVNPCGPCNGCSDYKKS